MVVVRRMCAVSILDTRRSVKNKLRNLAESLQVTQLGRQIGSQNFGGTSYSCGFFFFGGRVRNKYLRHRSVA